MATTPDDYVRTIDALLGDRDPVEVLARFDETFPGLLAGLSDEQLRRPEAPGKWSIHEIVRHMTETELAYGYRLRLVLTEDRPTFVGFDQDAWAALPGGDEPTVDEHRAALVAFRRIHLALIGALTPADRKRVAHHSERGPEDVERLLRLWAGHDLLHARQIERVREAVA